MDGYERLANAIVKKAADDYRQALKDLKRNPNYPAAQHMKNDCERFFQGQWITCLTTVDGPWLMRRLREEMR